MGGGGGGGGGGSRSSGVGYLAVAAASFGADHGVALEEECLGVWDSGEAGGDGEADGAAADYEVGEVIFAGGVQGKVRGGGGGSGEAAGEA